MVLFLEKRYWGWSVEGSRFGILGAGKRARMSATVISVLYARYPMILVISETGVWFFLFFFDLGNRGLSFFI